MMPAEVISVPIKKRRGRPFGSKNKPKAEQQPTPVHTPSPPVERDGRKALRQHANHKTREMYGVRLDTLSRDELIGIASYLLTTIEQIIDKHRDEIRAVIGVSE